MPRIIFIGLVLFAGVVASGQQLPGQKPFTQEAIDQAIEKGVEYLWASQKPDGSWQAYSEQFQIGPTAIAVYALLESGASAQDERMVKALGWLAKNIDQQIDSAKEAPSNQPFPDRDKPGPKTYELGLAANAFLAANRGTNNKYMPNLEKIAKWLYGNSNSGAYTYNVLKHARPLRIPLPWDNSNSQYGVLGVWAASTAEMDGIPAQYWQDVVRHWQSTQSADGGWPYDLRQKESTASMTLAGLASLYVAEDNLTPTGAGNCKGAPENPSIQKGMEWLSRHFDAYDAELWTTYYFYGAERVGLASGLKYFGGVDWYNVGCQKLLPLQQANGAWGVRQSPTVHDTAYALLFLIRGRQPILFNKLQYSGDWNNRPRDMANVTRWLTRQFENTVNWQIVNTASPEAQWHDAPILYIAGSREPKFTPREIQALRQYVMRGGTIFAVTECGGAGFTAGIKQLCKEMFPEYPLTPARATDAIYSRAVQFDLRGKPVFSIVSNGIRPLVIHTEQDLSKAWQLRQWDTDKIAFQGAGNVFMYVTDEGASLRPRDAALWPQWTNQAMERRVKIARLKVKGSSDPEPLAYSRFALLMANQTKTRVDVLGPMAVSELGGSGAKLATLTGMETISLTKEEKDSLRKFLDGGGTLLMDSAGGSKAFADSAKAVIEEMYGQDSLRRVSFRAELFHLKDYEIDKVKYRRKTRANLGMDKEPDLRAVEADGRLVVIFSAGDITTEGLLGAYSFGVEGYDPGIGVDGSAYQIMRNIVLYAGDPQPYVGPASQGSGTPTSATGIQAEEAERKPEVKSSQ